MWQWYFGQKILEWRIPNDTDFRNMLAQIVLKYNNLHNLIVNEFGPNGLYILVLFIFFITVLIGIYCKSVIETIRSARLLNNQTDASSDADSFYINEPAEDMHTLIANDNILENAFLNAKENDDLEQEKELSKDLVRVSALTSDYLHLSEDYKRLKNIMKKHAETEKANLDKWKDKQTKAADNGNEKQTDDVSISKLQKTSELISLILRLLGRHVTERKIAQAVYFYNHGDFSEEQILQIVRTIRDFIAICNTGKFDLLPDRQNYPQNQDALYALATGNNSPCLTLLQLLLNQYMERAEQEAGVFQEMTYAQAANCACILGNIALLSDSELAHNSFELATELSPHSVIAWSRLADMYMAENAQQKAMIAYQTVLDLADSPIYSEQIANAQQHLADYYQQQGLQDQASKYQSESTTFYGTYGLTVPLSDKEISAFHTIKESVNPPLQTTIAELLTAQNFSR